MDNYTKITKDALKYLAIMFASSTTCLPRHEKNEEYVVELAKKGKDISLKSFLKNLPEKSDLYQKIYESREERRKLNPREIYIDVPMLCRFFGGKNHIEKSLQDASEMNVTGLDEKRKRGLISFFTFIHVGTPFLIRDFDGEKCSGTYENEDVIVEIKNLMTFEMNKKNVKVDKVALSHFASVICVEGGHLNKKVMDEILMDQAHSHEFMRAARYLSEVGGIDFNNVSNLRDAAERMAQKYNL